MTGADSVAAKSLRTAKETSNDRSLLLCTYFTPHSSLLYFVTAIVVLPPSLSLSISLFLPLPLTVFISCLESGNLMKRKVKHLAGIRKHPCDNVVCISCVCALPQGIAERESVAGRGANKDRNLKMKLQMRIWSFI